MNIFEAKPQTHRMPSLYHLYLIFIPTKWNRYFKKKNLPIKKKKNSLTLVFSSFCFCSEVVRGWDTDTLTHMCWNPHLKIVSALNCFPTKTSSRIYKQERKNPAILKLQKDYIGLLCLLKKKLMITISRNLTFLFLEGIDPKNRIPQPLCHIHPGRWVAIFQLGQLIILHL